MTSNIFWADHLKHTTGYDVANDGLEWAKFNMHGQYTDGTSESVQNGMLRVLHACYPYFTTHYPGESSEQKKQWCGFLDAVGHEILTSQSMVGKDALRMLLAFSIITGTASMPLFERSALRVIKTDPLDETSAKLHPFWLDEVASLSHWISYEGRNIISTKARNEELNNDSDTMGFTRFCTAQISVGQINPEWDAQALEMYTSMWIAERWQNVLLNNSPMVFLAAFSSAAGPIIADQWAQKYIDEGITPKFVSRQKQYRLDKIIDTWNRTAWNIYDERTWQWLNGIQHIKASLEEREILLSGIYKRHPEWLKMYTKFEPIVSSLAGTLKEQAKLYAQLMRENSHSIDSNNTTVELPTLGLTHCWKR